MERVSCSQGRGEAAQSVCVYVGTHIHAHTHTTPRFSPKTERVARQQEHAVTGMSGFAFFFFFYLKRQVGV